MGCAAAKNSVIRELNTIITQIKQENLVLEEQRDNLKLQQELKAESDTRARDSMIYLHDLGAFLELQLLDAKHLGVAFLPPTNPDLALNEKISNFIQFQSELDEKVSTIDQLNLELFGLKSEKTDIEDLIAEYKKKLEEIDNATPYASKQYYLEQNYYKEQIFQLEANKKDQLQQIKDLEDNCKNFSSEIIAFDEKVKDDNTDAPTYEYLITLSNIELISETQKVDKEIEELAEHLKLAKQKEVESEEFHNYIDGLQRVVPSKLESLRNEYETFKEKAERLMQERNRLQEDLEKIKSEAQNNGFDKQLQVLNGLLDKDKSARSNLRTQRMSIAGEFEETLKRAKEVASSINNIRTKSFAFPTN